MSKLNSTYSGTRWRFRREMTFGTVFQVLAILVIVITTWSNLQKELALIQHDLNTLVAGSRQLHEHLESLTFSCREHEYRINALEQYCGIRTNTDKAEDEKRQENGFSTFVTVHRRKSHE